MNVYSLGGISQPQTTSVYPFTSSMHVCFRVSIIDPESACISHACVCLRFDYPTGHWAHRKWNGGILPAAIITINNKSSLRSVAQITFRHTSSLARACLMAYSKQNLFQMAHYLLLSKDSRIPPWMAIMRTGMRASAPTRKLSLKIDDTFSACVSHRGFSVYAFL